MKPKKSENLFDAIYALIQQDQTSLGRTINTAVVSTYFKIGCLIVEDEQNGKERAQYAEQILENLSKKLIAEFGEGFSRRNLINMKNFYLCYKDQIRQTVSAKSGNPFKLSWSHYVFLMRLDAKERQFYEIEAIAQNWSLRELERQYNSSLYERLALSRNKQKVKELSQKGQIIEQARDLIKNPYVLEFLGIPEHEALSETDLESAIIGKIEHFLKELGKGFLFVSRQQRISLENDNFYIDLVFYNRILRCFVLIDLKIGALKHQDLGQMQMYVNYYDRVVKDKEENKTIGIVLCKTDNKTVVEFTLPENQKQIFSSEYKLILPSKAQLVKQLESF